MTAAVCVIAEEESDRARAIPKSITFTAPVLVIMMFAGLISRWMMPASWLKCSASRTWDMMAAASVSRILPYSWTMSRSVSPCTRSITI